MDEDQSKPDFARLRAAARAAPEAVVGHPRWRAAIAAAATAAVLLVLAGLYAIYQFAFAGLPATIDAKSLWVLNRPAGITFVDETGEVLAIRGPSHGRLTRFHEMPEHLWQAFVAIEDARFFEHEGVDLWGLGRAAVANLAAGRTVQGGSTISQQLAKNLFLTPDRTFRRKLQEAIMADRLENGLAKEEILELYMNRIFLGEQAYGVDAAARRYFGVSARDVSLAQAAMLAGLPKAPSRTEPTRNFAAAKQRQSVVLEAMEKAGFITSDQRQTALAEPLEIAGRQVEDPVLGHALDMAQEEARRLAGAEEPDLVVQITIDPRLQAAAHRAIFDASRAWSERGKRLEGALVAVDHSGAVRALVGGVDYADSKFNRAAQARRQPGSTFKTFVYAAALEQGLTPDTVRYDEPIALRTETGAIWRPENYAGGHQGAVTLRSAFAQSLNTVAAEIGSEVGPRRIVELAERMGVRGPLSPVLSLSLGSSEVTLWEITSAFATFMREGLRADAYLVSRVSTSRGDVVFDHPDQPPQRVYDAALSRRMTGMMGRVVQSGTGVRAKLHGRNAAGKTGTSQDWRDAWFIGYTASYTAGVWIGYDDNSSMPRLSGGSAPAEIWADFMTAAHADIPPAPLAGIEPPGYDGPPRQVRRRAVAASFYDSLRDAFTGLFDGDDEEDEDDDGA